MRIAWISYDFEEYSALHVNELSAEHDALLIMPQPEDDAPRYEIDARVDNYEFEKPRLRQPIRQLQSLRGILRKLTEFQPDVVHFQQGHLWFNAVLRFVHKYPLVMTIHDPRHHSGDVASNKTPQWWMDYGFRQADQVIVHGDALKRQVQELFGFSSEQVHSIPHVAMGSTGTSGDQATEEHPNRVLFFGRIWDYKGLDQLIAAEPLISARCPDVEIMIAGEGEDFAKYKNMMVNQDRFLIHNSWISDQHREKFFQESALVVLPYNEATQSGVVPVAYNYSRPVVATRVGALAECVEHEKTGLLVEPRNPEQLADAIVRLIEDPELRHAMGQAGKQWLDEESSPRVVAAATAEVYRKAIAARNEVLETRSVAASASS